MAEGRVSETPTRDPLEPRPLIEGAQSPESLTGSLLRPIERGPGRVWWALFFLTLGGTGLFAAAIAVTLVRGIGAWGNNIPVAWAFGIIDFVWWIGFGHAGTLISAILVLFQQKWRASVNRFAEAMTLFAVMQAGLFPMLHLGRPWVFYWLVPYPSTLRVWPQFKSALPWDMLAITTYFTVSLLFWYLGLLPDLAAARDRAPTPRRQFWYGLFSLGWTGSARHWHHWRTGYLLLAALATPLVLSVHTIVSFDFAIAQVPGWHSTIFPPYFVAGAIFSGIALVLTLLLPVRGPLGLHHVITDKHVDILTKLLLATGLMVSYGYLQEHFFAWYSGDEYEMAAYAFKRTGTWGWLFWLQMFTNVLVPHLFWFSKLRTNLVVVWFAALAVDIGMWLERFTIIVPSLAHDFLPRSWEHYSPTWVDFGLLFGSMGFFGLLFLLFLKFIPPVPISEVKELHHDLKEALEEKERRERTESPLREKEA
ncbi:NrfD/PsrC family molybdoenzyme membrane anchor subunit [Archangium sp.]|uniref:NrfD/PsrC family molybdoenzyme membrane anchor subunit n=1 Tax=Archangium sp. TaxID=1872627 RepID=UPI002D631984|nr:NrfD/PsrC family molybdoenzyme membrane anchor subunit [Archangium sp.]HYO59300.1 NrfD/PsrC family molybdoenzyme membrane anchor subunit [Archangium sp.]